MTAIGIYDSGIGGISIYNSVKNLLPNEDYIYVADKKYFPYGLRDTETIHKRGDRIVSWFKQQNVKLIIIACNTSTVSALEYLRQLHPDIPIVGTVPVIKTCAKFTKTGKIGVLCTPQTAESPYQAELIEKFASDKEVYVIACPNLVEEIETGNFKESSAALSKPLSILLSKDVDTLALGCTHFPLITETIKIITGKKIKVLDSGDAIARQTKKVLKANKSLNNSNKKGQTLFYTTAKSQNFDIIASRYAGYKIKSESILI
ncbi:MAG: glutamate racemase [Candidatus Spechtbacterales bacterium]